MRLTGVMLGSENPGRLAQLYTQILGEPVWHQDDWYGYEVGGGSLMLGPHSEVSGRSSEPARVMISFDADDVPKEFDRIKALGAEVIAEPYRPSDENPDMWLATLADPDGNYFQLSTPWEE